MGKVKLNNKSGTGCNNAAGSVFLFAGPRFITAADLCAIDKIQLSPEGEDVQKIFAVGNRETGPGAKDSGYRHDAANRMEQGRRLQYGYDDNGNQTVKIVPGATEKSWVQSWDDENRLTRMEKVKGTERRTVSFAYDPQGRRISKELTTVIDGVTKTSSWSYVYDNNNIALEVYTDDTGAITPTYYTHGAGIDEHLALERSGGFHYDHADGLGSIVAITDAAKNVVQRYTYDTFGMVTAQTDFVNSYTYTGREWDKETGLYFYRARYYDPMEGRFVSKDPIGFKGGDMNLYNYVQNNPVNFVDPSGLVIAYANHKVAFYFYHSKIVIIPDNQAKYGNDVRFETDSYGRRYATIGAGPEKGLLVADKNRIYDRSKPRNNYTQLDLPCRYANEDEAIEELFEMIEAYNKSNYLPYTLVPKENYQYNSNSFISGIGAAGGFSMPTNTGTYTPGYENPVPWYKF